MREGLERKRQAIVAQAAGTKPVRVIKSVPVPLVLDAPRERARSSDEPRPSAPIPRVAAGLLALAIILVWSFTFARKLRTPTRASESSRGLGLLVAPSVLKLEFLANAGQVLTRDDRVGSFKEEADEMPRHVGSCAV